MTDPTPSTVGFACAYAPLPLLRAAGFMPYRVLPVGGAPDQAGTLLHDNLCPHVKRILDRGLAGDLPALAGLVMIDSCDAMRRLADAWLVARPQDSCTLLDLPVTADDQAVAYFAAQLERLGRTLVTWGGRQVTDDGLRAACARHDELVAALESCRALAAVGRLRGGWPAYLRHQQLAVTQPLEESLDQLHRLAGDPVPAAAAAVPVILFGNVLVDPEAYEILAACGAAVTDDDLCTGARQLTTVGLAPDVDPLAGLAAALLRRPACARTVDPSTSLASQVVARAQAAGARGVIAHIMKFCDPYLARLPAVRAELRQAGLPLLVLEGDCTARSLGQHRTRIEAFVEMLAEAQS